MLLGIDAMEIYFRQLSDLSRDSKRELVSLTYRCCHLFGQQNYYSLMIFII